MAGVRDEPPLPVQGLGQRRHRPPRERANGDGDEQQTDGLRRSKVDDGLGGCVGEHALAKPIPVVHFSQVGREGVEQVEARRAVRAR